MIAEARMLALETPWAERDWQMALDAIGIHPYREQLLDILRAGLGPHRVGALLAAVPQPWWALDRHHPPRGRIDGHEYHRRQRARVRRRR